LRAKASDPLRIKGVRVLSRVEHAERSGVVVDRTRDALTDVGDDERLARAAALGDRVAFEMIVRRHTPALLRYATHQLGWDADAQDVVQEALLAAWRNLDRFDGRSALRTWLFAVLSHKLVDHRRRRRPVPVPDDALLTQPADPAADPARHAVRAELVDALRSALAELPHRQRATWLLIEIEGLTQREAAAVLRLTPDAVRGNVFRARRTLGERLARWR
jgi:RNA polymerase sigma-70 factor (ECF subfamily)